MRRRHLLISSALAWPVLGLSACSSAVNGGGSDATVRDTLRIGLGGGTNTLDPHNTASIGTDLSVIGSIYSSLVRATPEGEIIADAAESWEQTDATTWRFTLAPGITYSDGTALTPQTVVWNVRRVQDPDLGMRLQAFFTNLAEVVAVDETTLDIRTEQPDADLLKSLSLLFLLDPAWTEQNDPAGDAMGSGPYLLADYTPKGPLTLTAREDHWATPATISRVEYQDLGNSEAEINALQAGEVDLVSGLSPKDMDRLQSDDRVRLIPIESSRASFVKFNTTLAPVDDVRVRQALNYAVDKQAIIDSVLRGTVEQSSGQILTSVFAGYDPDLEPYPFEPDTARALLAEAGFADGLELALEYPTDTYVEADAIVQAITAQLAEVGVTVSASTAPFDVWLSKYAQEGNMAQTIYLSQSWPTTSMFLGLFEDGNPYSYWPDTHFKELLDGARYAATAEEQQARYSETLEHFREQAPVLFLWSQPAIYGTASAVTWKPSPDGWILPYEISFTE